MSDILFASSILTAMRPRTTQAIVDPARPRIYRKNKIKKLWLKFNGWTLRAPAPQHCMALFAHHSLMKRPMSLRREKIEQFYLVFFYLFLWRKKISNTKKTYSSYLFPANKTAQLKKMGKNYMFIGIFVLVSIVDLKFIKFTISTSKMLCRNFFKPIVIVPPKTIFL